jgi:hypothetical protein
MIYRGDNSLDSRTTKIHAQKRTGLNYAAILSLVHATCETGERLLKTEAKGISKTAQQRGISTFERQTCCRIGDKLVMDKFGELLEKWLLDQPVEEENENDEKELDRFSRKHAHFILTREGGTVAAFDRFGKARNPDENSGYLDETVITALLDLEPQVDTFQIFTEVILRNDSRIRACPNYSKSGSWYDFVNVQWGKLLPARALCFYRKGEGDDGDPLALVHGVNEDSKGTVNNGFFNTLLTTHYRLDYHARHRTPVITSIPVASIDSAIMAVLHKPSDSLFDSINSGVMAVRPRNQWAYFWLAWNEELRSINEGPTTKKKKKYVSLTDSNLLKVVRENAQKKLEIPIVLT